MNSVKTLFASPFRIFFLSTAIWAFFAILLWTLHVSGVLSLHLAHEPFVWHRHEMLYGVLNPAIAGFLLTAVCVWTGTDRLHGLPLLMLWLVWLAGRLAATGAGPEMWAVSVAVNLSFLPLTALDAGRRIVAARQWRQLVVLLIIALLWLMQAGTLLLGLSIFTSGALVLAAALMLIVGGRITPAFSANWLRARGSDPEQVRTRSSVEILLLVSLLLLFLAALLNHGGAITLMAVITTALTLARLWLWRSWLFSHEPLLWILHLSQLWIALALLLLAGHYALDWPATAWQHALGIGAMGGLILGVMTRVALGHTGRPMQLPACMTTAYGLIQLAVVVRLLTVFAVIPWQLGITISATAWTFAFALFVWRYLPVLCSPRVDGKPG